MTPLVSVIVPVHDGARFLGAALESIAAQDYAPLEVLVVDDGSTDGSVAVARRYDVHVIEQPRRGVAAARNAGIAASHGELLMFLDQDDLWLPAKARRQAEALVARPEQVSLVWNEYFLDASIEALPKWFSRPELLEAAHPGWAPSCFAFTRATFDRIGRFDESYAQASDSDWLARAQQHVPVEIIAETLVRRRIHGANDSGSPTAMRELLRVMRESAARQRSAASSKP